MRKLLGLLLAISLVTVAQAQNFAVDSVDLKEYTGRYVFPGGSQVTEIKVVVENGILFATSDQGSSELKLIRKDEFEIVAYMGTATFKRNEKGNVASVYIQIGDMILDGKKEGSE